MLYSSSSPTAYAVGDLTIDWGVPNGTPVFNISNLAPGQEVTHQVQITNNATVPRLIGVQVIKVSESSGLSQALELIVLNNNQQIYKGILNPEIFLTQFQPNQTSLVTFKVVFLKSAGNKYQNSKLVFDLKIGAIATPSSNCEGKYLPEHVITGTQGNDVLIGTSGNDLIMGLEGSDIILGLGGDDCLIGGAGKDIIIGGKGSDKCEGEIKAECEH